MTAASIKIIADTDDFLVIDKPSSIPVHPCGRYRHNSITHILGKEHGFRNLRGAVHVLLYISMQACLDTLHCYFPLEIHEN